MPNAVKLIISGDSTGAQTALNQVSQKTESTISQIREHWIGITAVLASVYGAFKKLQETVTVTQTLGMETAKLQRITGMTAETASEFIAVADQVGISFDTLQTAVTNVTRRMGGLKGIEDMVTDASGDMVDVFEKYGVTVKNADGTTKSFSDVFEQIRKKIQDAGSATERMAIATQFFRGNAAQLMPLLTMSSAQFKEIAEDAKKYGIILSQDNVNSVREYTMAHRDLDDAVTGLKLTIGKELIPILKESVIELTKNISAMRDFVNENRALLSLPWDAFKQIKEDFSGLAMAVGVLLALRLGPSIAVWIASIGSLGAAVVALLPTIQALLLALTAFASYEFFKNLDSELYRLSKTDTFLGKLLSTIDKLAKKLSGGWLDLSGPNELAESLGTNIELSKDLQERMSKISAPKLTGLGFTGPNAMKDFNDAVKEGRLVWDAAIGDWKKLEKQGNDTSAMAKKLAEEWTKTKAQLELDIAKSGLTDFEQKLLDITFKAEELRKQFGDKPLILKWETQKSVEILDQDYMRQEEEQIEQAKKVADAQTWLSDRINSLTLSEYEYKKEKLREEYAERAKYLGWTLEMYEAFSQDMKQLSNEEIKIKLISDAAQEEHSLSLQRDQTALMKEAYEITGQWNESRQAGITLLEQEGALSVKRLEQERALLELQLDQFDLSDEEFQRLSDIVDLYGGVINALKTVNQLKVQEANLRLENPMAAAIQDVNKEWGDANQQMYDISKKTYEGMADAFSNIFFDSIKGQMKSFGDYFKSIWDSILRYFTDIIARMIAQWIAGLLGMKTAEQGANLGSSLFGGATGTATQGALGGATNYAGLGASGAGAFSGGAGATSFNAAGIEGSGLSSEWMLSGTSGAGGLAMAAKAGMIAAVAYVFTDILSSLATGSWKTKTTHYPTIQMGYKGGEATPEVGLGKYGKGISTFFGDDAVQKLIDDPLLLKFKDKFETAFTGFSDMLKVFAEDFGIDISNFAKDWEAARKTIKSEADAIAYINTAMGDYAKFATGIDFKKFQKDGEAMVDTIGRIIIAMYGFKNLNESIDLFIEAVEGSYDELSMWKDALNEASVNIDQLRDSLAKAVDPTDIVNYGEQLKQAIYSRYQLEIDFINGLSNKIEDLKNQLADLALSQTQTLMRISKLGGNVDYGSIKTNLESVFFDLYGKFSGEGTGEQKIAWVDQMINVAEEWVNAVEESIRMQYEPMIEANNAEIETLNKQLVVLRQWQTLNDSLKRTILDLTTSLSSPADVMERVGISQGEVERLQGLYAGSSGTEKAGYGTELETALRNLLTIGQEAYQRPSTEYQNLFEYVISALQQMESDSSGYADQAKTADERIAFLTEDNNRLQGLMQADLDGIQGTITEASNWLAQAVIAAYDLRSGEIVTEISKDQSALKSVIGDLTVGTYIEQLKTATVTELQAIKGLLEQQWGTTGLPNPGETATNTGGGGGSGGEAGGTGGTSGGGTGGGVEKFIGPFGGGSVYPPEYWGMTFTQGNEGRWKQVVQEALESLGFSPSAMLSNLSADNRALVLNEYADLLSSVYSFLANQTAPFTVPSYQSGTDYVPQTGLALLHQGEKVIPVSGRKAEGNITIHISSPITINASGDASPKEIAKETRREFAHFLRYDVGREIVKEIQRSTR